MLTGNTAAVLYFYIKYKLENASIWNIEFCILVELKVESLRWSNLMPPPGELSQGQHFVN